MCVCALAGVESDLLEHVRWLVETMGEPHTLLLDKSSQRMAVGKRGMNRGYVFLWHRNLVCEELYRHR